MSQNEAILDYLKHGNTLTGLDALRVAGTMKLASRISEIKKDENFIKSGDRIVSETITTDNGKRVARYKLIRNGKLF